MIVSAEAKKLFLERTSIRPNGCVEWTGSVTASGYGRLSVARKTYRAHRVAYALFIGSLPDYNHSSPNKLVIDHRCRNKLCVAPWHLELVTDRENILRGAAPTAVNAAKSECKRGHPFDERNTGTVRWRGVVRGRSCRRCAVEATQRYYARKGRARAI